MVVRTSGNLRSTQRAGGRAEAGGLSVWGASEGTLLRKLWLTSGMTTEKHAAEQSFVGMAKVITYAAELAPVLGRRESHRCK